MVDEGQTEHHDAHHAKVDQVFGPVGAERRDPKGRSGEGAHQGEDPDGVTSGGAVGHIRTGDGVERS